MTRMSIVAVLTLVPVVVTAQDPAAEVLAFEREVEAAVVHGARMNTVEGPHFSKVK